MFSNNLTARPGRSLLESKTREKRRKGFHKSSVGHWLCQDTELDRLELSHE